MKKRLLAHYPEHYSEPNLWYPTITLIFVALLLAGLWFALPWGIDHILLAIRNFFFGGPDSALAGTP